MKRIQTGLLVAGLLSAGAVLAQPGPGFFGADTDGDGALSLAELQAVNPNVTQERFEIMDTDANGLITADERPMRPGRPGRPGRGFGPGRP